MMATGRMMDHVQICFSQADIISIYSQMHGWSERSIIGKESVCSNALAIFERIVPGVPPRYWADRCVRALSQIFGGIPHSTHVYSHCCCCLYDIIM
jgi:hypothetical protein